MKIVDFSSYKIKKEISILENRTRDLVSISKNDSAREMKSNFKEWMKINSKSL